MNYASAATVVMNALSRASKVEYEAWHWTFTSKDGTEVVEFIANIIESKYVYTRTKKFLCFKIGTEQFTLSSNDNEIDWAVWNEIGDVKHNTLVRFGIIS